MTVLTHGAITIHVDKSFLIERKYKVISKVDKT